MPSRCSTTMCTLLAAGVLLSGCVGFNGPNDIRRQIATREDVVLDKRMGISVGPIGVALAQLLAAKYIPFDTSGIMWFDYGEYEIRSPSAARPTPLRLRAVALPDWERIVRLQEGDDETVVMVDSFDEPLRKVLVLLRNDDRLQIIRARGDLERVVDQMLASDLLGTGQRLGGGATGGGSAADPPDDAPVRAGGGTGG